MSGESPKYTAHSVDDAGEHYPRSDQYSVSVALEATSGFPLKY